MKVRVLFPPDGSNYVDFDDVDDYYYSDDEVYITRKKRTIYGEFYNEKIAYFTKGNIIGLHRKD